MTFPTEAKPALPVRRSKKERPHDLCLSCVLCFPPLPNYFFPPNFMHFFFGYREALCPLTPYQGGYAIDLPFSLSLKKCCHSEYFFFSQIKPSHVLQFKKKILLKEHKTFKFVYLKCVTFTAQSPILKTA